MIFGDIFQSHEVPENQKINGETFQTCKPVCLTWNSQKNQRTLLWNRKLRKKSQSAEKLSMFSWGSSIALDVHTPLVCKLNKWTKKVVFLNSVVLMKVDRSHWADEKKTCHFKSRAFSTETPIKTLLACSQTEPKL